MRLCRDLCVEAKNKVPPIHAHIMRMPTQIMSTRSQILGMPTQLMRAQSK